MVLQAQRTSATADSGHLLAEEPGDEDQILALSYRIRLHYCKQGGGSRECLPADLGLVLADTGDEAKIVGFTRDRIGQLRRCKGRIATGDVIAGVGGDCCGTRESVIRQSPTKTAAWRTGLVQLRLRRWTWTYGARLAPRVRERRSGDVCGCLYKDTNTAL